LIRDPSRSPDFPHTARLTVDLDALADNYRRLRQLALPGRCAAVVKADAYGLGMAAVAARLAAEGCSTFFVATAREALELRGQLADSQIGVFEGVPVGAEQLFLDGGIVPVVNTLEELTRWVAAGEGARVPTILHIDTGMTRLGFDAGEVRELAAHSSLLNRIDLRFTMTHLACADDPAHPLTSQQLARFAQLRALLPEAPTSIGNSAGLLRGADSSGDLARPGIALYGGQGLAGGPFTPTPVVRWQGRILQVRQITETTTIGYDATRTLEPPTVVATIAVGYADGYRRALGDAGRVGVGTRLAPVVGRVSMDLISVDVSECDAGEVCPGSWVDLIGGHIGLEALAAQAGTISYELLTGLGQRSERVYKGDVRSGSNVEGAVNDG
jgi:alanine racemase